MLMADKLKTFVCIRYYAIGAKDEKEAKEIMRQTENEIDYLKEKEWEEAEYITKNLVRSGSTAITSVSILKGSLKAVIKFGK